MTHKKLSIDELGEQVLAGIIEHGLVQVTAQGTMSWAENSSIIIGQAVRAALMSDSEQERAIQSAASVDLLEELLKRHAKALVYLETPNIQAGANGDDGARLFMLRFKPDRMTGIGIADTAKAMLLSRELASSMMPEPLPYDDDLDDLDDDGNA